MRWLFDTQEGRLLGDFTVEIKNSEILFSYSETTNLCKSAPEGTDAFSRLANLVQPLSRIDQITRNDNEAYWPDTRPYSALDSDSVLELAREFGPLFGRSCAKPDGRTVAEPLSAWKVAAQILNFACRAEAQLSDTRVLGDIDEDVVYQWRAYENGSYAWVIAYTAAKHLPQPYRSQLNLSAESLGALRLPKVDLETGQGFRQSNWSIGDKEDASVLASWYCDGICEGKPSVFGIETGPSLRSQSQPTETAMSTEQSLIEELVQALTSLHVVNVRLGWGLVKGGDGGGNVATLTPQFNNYLERLWYCFGLAHSSCRVRTCKECGKVIIADKKRRFTKEFCNDRCRTNHKKTRSNAEKTAILTTVKRIKSEEEGYQTFGEALDSMMLSLESLYDADDLPNARERLRKRLSREFHSSKR